MKLFITFLLSLLTVSLWGQKTDAWTGQDGQLTFVSDAPLELISAKSDNLGGVLVPSSGRFAFQVDIISFEGFNNPLQRIHFQENYMEIHKYPKAIFEGRILDDIPWDNKGKYEVRAKGILNLHGIENERIIKGSIIIGDDLITINSEFTIALEDHQILVPRIVHQKIAEEILVSLGIELQ